MTAEQQRIAIAGLMGWTKIDPRGWSGYTRIWNPLCSVSDERPGYYYGYVPDFLNDLNACAEFEKTLTRDEAEEYAMMICRLVNDLDPTAYVHWSDIGSGNTFATAPQRSEAFLRTKNLWTDQ